MLLRTCLVALLVQYVRASELAVEWSGWSPCSKFCDVGVTKANASCDSLGNCLEDGRIRYRLCNEEPCPSTFVGFRDHQCAQYNSPRTGEFLSFYESSEPCKLYCRKAGTAVVEKKTQVRDGTRCLKDQTGICLNGHCWIADCDKDRRRKGCEICGLNGTVCTRYMWHIGKLSPCTVTCGEGVQVASVRCRDIILNKYVADGNCDESMRPQRTSKTCKKECDISWYRGIWSRCSRTCERGRMIRDVYCSLTSENTFAQKIDESYCTRKKPRTRAACNKGSCPRWSIGKWTSCSPSCSIGVQYRNASCTNSKLACPISTAPVTSRPCYPTSSVCPKEDTIDVVPMMRSFQADQSRQYSAPRWKLLFKGPCSATCNIGIRALTYQCETYDYKTRRRVKLSDLKCLGSIARPPELEKCNIATCYRDTPRRLQYINPITYLWRYSGYSECSAQCLGGKKRATVECVQDVDRRIVSKILCDPTTQPKDLVVSCNTVSCPPRWVIGEWTKCSSTCGRGIETRAVECVQQYGRSEEHKITLPAYRCTSIPPIKTRFCGTSDCPPRWYVGEWSECTPNCGGLRMRQVECRMRNSNGTMVTLHGRNELQCTEPRMDAWQPCGEKNCDTDSANAERRKSVQIAIDESVLVQTKRRKKMGLTVGGVNTIIPGTILTIRCPIRSARPRDIRWSKVGRGPIAGVGRVRKNRKGILKIFRSRPTDEGVYQCRMDDLSANVTLKFHSARQGQTLFGRRKDYLNRRAEQDTASAKRNKNKGTKKKDFLLSDAVNHNPKNFSATPYDFVVGEWSPCSKTCGGRGLMTRIVTCEVIMEEFYRIVEDRLCTDYGLTRPEDRKTCSGGECPYWKIGVWNRKCTNKCLRNKIAVQRRHSVCVLKNGTHLGNDHCPQFDAPVDERECTNRGCRAMWKVSTFSKCSRTCGGKGIRTRMLRCVWKGRNVSAGRLCANLPRPSLVRRCFTPPCRRKCEDSSAYCSLTKKLRLCRYRAYRRLCCASCTRG